METELPATLNLYDFAEVPSFDSWDKGKKALSVYNEAIEKVNTQRKYRPFAMWGCIILGIIGIGVGGWLLFIVAVFLNNSIAGSWINNAQAKAESELSAVQTEHAGMVTNAVGPKLMNGEWTWFRSQLEILMYSSDRFAYIDDAKGSMVAYNNSNIKEVSRERVHTGAHTTASSNTVGGGTAIGNTGLAVGTAKTNTTSDTTDFYEWHFDIMTDYISYPKVSFVIPDGGNTEDLIGKAYAVLKP